MLYLESYDDALNSLHLGSRSTASSLPSIAARLDLESWDLQVFAREGFVDPFEHRLELRRHGRDLSARVSLVETFEFLIGLRPTHRGPCSSFDTDFGVDESGRLRLEGELRPAAEGSGWRFQAVWGACPEASRVLVVWRTSSGDRVRDELVLRAFLRRLVTDSERPGAELLWINGDHDLGADRGLAERWRVRRIEDELCRTLAEPT